MTSRTVRVGVAVAAQLLLVGAAVQAPLSARLTGDEVRLRVQTVDPVDPFRGAYVDLGYPDLPEQPGAQGVDLSSDADARGTAYVPLTREGAVWVGGEVQRTAPEGTYLRCDDSGWRLRCGIESLFLPQDDAVEVDRAVRSGAAIATVRVDSSGHAALIGVAPAP